MRTMIIFISGKKKPFDGSPIRKAEKTQYSAWLCVKMSL